MMGILVTNAKIWSVDVCMATVIFHEHVSVTRVMLESTVRQLSAGLYIYIYIIANYP